jgi:hypothetical protein
MVRTRIVTLLALMAALGSFAALGHPTTPVARAAPVSLTAGSTSQPLNGVTTLTGALSVSNANATLSITPLSGPNGTLSNANPTAAGATATSIPWTAAELGNSSSARSVSATFTCPDAPAVILAVLTQADAQGSQQSVQITCGATPTPTGTPATATPTLTPTATGTPQVSTVTVSVAPSSLSCTGSAFVTVVAKDAAGSPIAGGSVTLSTTLGVISPTTATDTGAGVLAVLSGNGVGGTATITANVSGVTGTATAQINCAAATATPVPPTAVPQQPASPRPPNTGDAGLLGGGSTPRVALGLLLIGLASAGTLGAAWRRVHS